MIATALLGFAVVFTVNVAKAQPTGALLFVAPQNSIFSSAPVGTWFLVNVTVANVTDIAGIEFTLNWDPTLLTCNSMTDVFYSDPLITKPSDIPSNIEVFSAGIDNVAGTAGYAETWLNAHTAESHGYDPANITETGSACGNPTYSWPNGEHAVCQFNFTVLQQPNSTVPILGCALHISDDVLGDPNAVPITHTSIDGLYENRYTIPPALVYVDPQEISNVSLTPGSNFIVNISIANATDVFGLQFELSFNATLVEADTVTSGSLIPASVTPITQIDNTSGFVSFNASLSSPLNGNGVLAVISFQVQALGATALHLYGAQLVDAFGQPLPFTVADGSFTNILLAKLAIDPSSIIDPTLVPPATFMINVTIAEVSSLYGYQFNLTFDPKILVCLSVQINDVLNETNYTPNENVDNTAGFAFVNVTYYPPGVPLNLDSATPFVTINFRVKTIGETNLTLTDTELVDSTGQPITHEDYNGFFQSLIVDMAVLAVSASLTAFYQGESTNVTVVVANLGNATESCVLDVYYNSTLLTAMNITSLAPNANATVIILWNTTSVLWGYYVMSAYVPPLPYETNVANNNFTDGIVMVKIPGDLNGDGTVNILDSIILANAFLSHGPNYDYPGEPASPNWNPNADLNGDNVVNILDAILLAENFGITI
jgi:hypothetical protein